MKGLLLFGTCATTVAGLVVKPPRTTFLSSEAAILLGQQQESYCDLWERECLAQVPRFKASVVSFLRNLGRNFSIAFQESEHLAT